MKKNIRIILTAVISLLILVPMYLMRLKIYDLFFARFLKFIPDFLIIPVDIVIFIIGCLPIVCIVYLVLELIFKSKDN